MEENRIIKFDKARFEILTENLIRIEYSETGNFEDNKTQIIQNREFSPVKFDIIKKEWELTKEVIVGEIDKLLADEVVKNTISKFHIDKPPFINNTSDNGGTSSALRVKRQTI